jgi:hypothetical protein
MRPRTVLGLVALGLLLGGPQRPLAAAEKLDTKRIAELAGRWFAARPKTCFVDWDHALRAKLVKEAEDFGPLPEGSLSAVKDLLWKAVRKHAPGFKEEIDTPYGAATWIQKGAGGPRSGLILGLHGGGEGAGDAGEAAGKWVAPGHMGMYPQGIRLVHDTWNTVHGERFEPPADPPEQLGNRDLRRGQADRSSDARREVLQGKTAIAELAEQILTRLSRVIGGGTFHRASPIGHWAQDVKALGFLRPPWGLAWETLIAGSKSPSS